MLSLSENMPYGALREREVKSEQLRRLGSGEEVAKPRRQDDIESMLNPSFFHPFSFRNFNFMSRFDAISGDFSPKRVKPWLPTGLDQRTAPGGALGNSHAPRAFLSLAFAFGAFHVAMSAGSLRRLGNGTKPQPHKPLEIGHGELDINVPTSSLGLWWCSGSVSHAHLSQLGLADCPPAQYARR